MFYDTESKTYWCKMPIRQVERIGERMIINWLLAVVLVAGIAVIAVSFAEWLRERELNKVIFIVNRIK